MVCVCVSTVIIPHTSQTTQLSIKSLLHNPRSNPKINLNDKIVTTCAFRCIVPTDIEKVSEKAGCTPEDSCIGVLTAK